MNVLSCMRPGASRQRSHQPSLRGGRRPTWQSMRRCVEAPQNGSPRPNGLAMTSVGVKFIKSLLPCCAVADRGGTFGWPLPRDTEALTPQSSLRGGRRPTRQSMLRCHWHLPMDRPLWTLGRCAARDDEEGGLKFIKSVCEGPHGAELLQVQILRFAQEDGGGGKTGVVRLGVRGVGL